MPLLIKCTKLPDPQARNEAVMGMSKLGTAAKLAISALQAIADDKDETVRKSVADAL